jgi:hypothetical protein
MLGKAGEQRDQIGLLDSLKLIIKNHCVPQSLKSGVGRNGLFCFPLIDNVPYRFLCVKGCIRLRRRIHQPVEPHFWLARLYGCLDDFRAIGDEVVVAEIVSQNDHDIRRTG